MTACLRRQNLNLRKNLNKRPIVGLLLLYVIFLFIVLVSRPDWGEAIFGWERREQSLLALWDEDPGVKGTILSLEETSYGKTALLSGTLSADPHVRVKIRVYLPKDTDLMVGDKVFSSGKITLAQPATNPGQWDQQQYQRLRKIDFTLRPTETQTISEKGRRSVFLLLVSTRDGVKNQIRLLWEEPYSGVVAAMLTGDTSLMEEEEKALFSQAGIAHIIAISGLHLSILISLLERKRKGSMLSRRQRIITDVIIWLYTLWTGGSVATVRAALMASVRHSAALLNRLPDEITGVCFAMLVQLLINPLWLKTAGFWLSYGAFLGLWFGKRIGVRIRRLVQNPLVPYIVWKKVTASLGVVLLTMPVVKWFFYQTSVFSFILNLWVIPAMQLLIPFCLAAIGLSFLHPALGIGFAYLAKGLLISFEWGSQTMIEVEKGLFSAAVRTAKPEVYEIVFYYLILFLVFIAAKKIKTDGLQKPKTVFVLTGTLILVLWLILPSHRWRVAYLDVGQGDCAVIEWEGKVILIDAGPAYQKVILPYLEVRGITQIDLAILSHPDQDHMDGLMKLAEEGTIPIRSLWIADQKIQNTQEMRRLLELLETQGTQITRLKAGDSAIWTKGRQELRLDVVSPTKEYESGNLGSLAVMIRFLDHAFLFTGDMEQASEEDMIQSLSPGLKECHPILKAAHHGSETSTTATLLETFQPLLAVISCGRNNSYGHPSKETILRLQTAGVPYQITAVSGCVMIQGDLKAVHYYTFLRHREDP